MSPHLPSCHLAACILVDMHPTSSSRALPEPLCSKLHTIKSERWSDPELKPLVSESEGLLERESRMGRVSRRDPLTEGAGNLSTKSDPRGSRGRKLKGGFPRTLPNGLWSMLNTREKKKGGNKKEVSWPLSLLSSQEPLPFPPTATQQDGPSHDHRKHDRAAVKSVKSRQTPRVHERKGQDGILKTQVPAATEAAKLLLSATQACGSGPASGNLYHWGPWLQLLLMSGHTCPCRHRRCLQHN